MSAAHGVWQRARVCCFATSESEHVLAIDLGTSGPKVALVTPQGRVVACEHHPTALRITADGGAEQDPEDWWLAIVAATAKLHAREAVPARSVVAVAVTGQWAGTVAVGEGDRVLHPALTWLDSRGASYVAQIAGGLVRVAGYGPGKLARWVSRTGGAPSLAGKEPLAHILWLRYARPEIYREAQVFLEPKDYINLRLCGERAATYDSIALHWVTDNRAIDRIDYDEDLLALATLDRNRLPPLRHATEVLGTLLPEAASALGIPATARVIGGTPDVQSAAIGSGAVADFQPHVYLGTSSWLSCHVPFKKTDLHNNMASLPSALPGRYILANAQETAGKCLEWLRDNILCRDDVLGHAHVPDPLAAFNELASQAPAGSGGVIFTPWLYGERSPRADRTLRAGFHNQSLATTRSELVRAVLEGVAFNNRWLLGAVERFCGRRMEPLRMIGGGARSGLWCQVFADVLGRHVEQVEDPVQCNARGVALVASLGLGMIGVDDLASSVRVARRYEPTAQHRAVYDAQYAAYLRLYRSTRGIFARMNRSS